MLNIIFDDGENGKGWYVDLIINNCTKNICFNTNKESAIMDAALFATMNGNIPIRML